MQMAHDHGEACCQNAHNDPVQYQPAQCIVSKFTSELPRRECSGFFLNQCTAF